MKYTFLIFILFFISCRDKAKTIELTKEQYDKLLENNSGNYPKPIKIYSNKIERTGESGIVDASDGHEYLIRNSSTSSETCEHYIDCRKCEDGYLPYFEDSTDGK